MASMVTRGTCPGLGQEHLDARVGFWCVVWWWWWWWLLVGGNFFINLSRTLQSIQNLTCHGCSAIQLARVDALCHASETAEPSQLCDRVAMLQRPQLPLSSPADGCSASDTTSRLSAHPHQPTQTSQPFEPLLKTRAMDHARGCQTREAPAAHPTSPTHTQ